ncbi:MAG: hypothetical protein QF718_09950 [Phycisphaerales bacterium]|jgi:hypothetical protein|nr:hypothetical protein [Phycisphaerales bacterium]
MNGLRFNLVLASLFLITNVNADTVFLRGGENPVTGTILSGGWNGLMVKPDGSSSPTVLQWSRISEIESETNKQNFELFLDQGEQLWRAQERLLRGDIQLAEPLFEKHFKEYVGSECADGFLVSEGLLRCALSRGDLDRAVQPWLETIRHYELGTEYQFELLEPILDESTLLCPHLPPAWLDEESVVRLCRSYTSSPQKNAKSVASIIAGGSEIELEETLKVFEGGQFLVAIIGAAKGDSKYSEMLLSRVEDYPEWKSAWVHYFVGLGYLSKLGQQERTKGMLHLAEVAATSTRIVPWLAGDSMIRLSVELEKEGFTQESNRVRLEAKRLFPTHPKILGDENE